MLEVELLQALACREPRSPDAALPAMRFSGGDLALQISALRNREENRGSRTVTSLHGTHRAADRVVTRLGLVDGRKVFAYARDVRLFGGALGALSRAKVQEVVDLTDATGA